MNCEHADVSRTELYMLYILNVGLDIFKPTTAKELAKKVQDSKNKNGAAGGGAEGAAGRKCQKVGVRCGQ